MTYTIAYDPTYPSGTSDADTLDTIIQNVQKEFAERLSDLFGIADFTADPLKNQYVRVGYGTAGFGGHVRYTSDDGILRWYGGVQPGNGNKNFVIYDVVNALPRLTIAFDTGVVTGNIPTSNLSGTDLPGSIINSSLTKVGTITTGVWNGTPIVDAYLAGITGSKVSGNVANATLADNATNLGGIAAGNYARKDVAVTFANTVTATQFNGSGAGLTNIPGANVTGTVANATNAVNATNATNAGNAATLNGYNYSVFAFLSGATFTGDVHAPHYYIG